MSSRLSLEKGLKRLIDIELDAAAATMQKMIEDGLGQRIDEDAYETYKRTCSIFYLYKYCI